MINSAYSFNIKNIQNIGKSRIDGLNQIVSGKVIQLKFQFGTEI
jgi:hypothetical protein